jgi:hypothetical protein
MWAHGPGSLGSAESEELVGEASIGEGEGERTVAQCLVTDGESEGPVVTIDGIGMADIWPEVKSVGKRV